MLQRSPALVAVCRRRKANDSPASLSLNYGIGTQCRCVTVRTLRIASTQLRAVRSRPPSSETPVGPARAVRVSGHYSDMVHRLFSGRVAEWQTRWLQVPVSFGTWGFKSPFAHNCDDSRHGLRITWRWNHRVDV